MMETKTYAYVALMISVIAVILGAYAIMSSTDVEKGDAKYTLYFGLDSDSSAEEMDAAEWYILGRIVDSGNGYTCFWSEGGYATEDTVVRGQHTLVVIIAFADQAFIDSLVEDAKTELSLDSVLVEKTCSEMELV